MKDSIIINMRYSGYDLIDGKPNVERHHCLMGPDRAKADEDGLWVPLTKEHHTAGKISAHQCKEMRVLLEMLARCHTSVTAVRKAWTRMQHGKRSGKDTGGRSYEGVHD